MKVSRKSSSMNRVIWIIGPFCCYLTNSNYIFMEAFIAPINYNPHPHSTVHLSSTQQRRINLPQLLSVSSLVSLGKRNISLFYCGSTLHQIQP